VRRALPLIAVALLAPACGNHTRAAGPEGGAAVAPSSTALLVRAKTDFASEQWQALKPLLALVSGSNDLASYLESFKGVVGPETDAVSLDPSALSRQTVVGLTQPPDPAKLQATLITNDPPLVSEEVAGWHVIAQHRATIDRFKRARNEGTLASSSAYKEATDGLPAQAVASVYLDGTALTEALDRRIKTGTGPIPGFGRVSWLAGAITAEPGGLGVHARLKGDEIEVSEYKAELPAEVPTPVSLFVDEKGLDATLDEIKRSPALTAQLGSVAKLLGSGLLDDAIALFRGEAALYVRPLPKGPEYTLVVKVDDEDRANQVVDRLTTLAGAASQALPEHPRIAGVLATKLTVAKTTLYLGVFDGKVVVTNQPSGIRGLVLQGPRLADSPGWQGAAQAAQLPEETAGIAYADVQRALPLLQTLAGAKPHDGLAPLGNGMLWASVGGSVLTVNGSVAVR
jgi:Protein of unknown function (DUF3352)